MTIVDFIQENMRVLATVCDRDIGGRNFDDLIVEFLAETFQKKTGEIWKMQLSWKIEKSNVIIVLERHILLFLLRIFFILKSASYTI